MTLPRVESMSAANSTITFAAERSSTSTKWGSGFFGGLAVASILVPIHPSVQGIFHQFGISSVLLFLILWLPLLCRLAYERSVRRTELFSLIPFLGYGLWLVMTSAYSQATGLGNWTNSVRGVAVILPCVMVAAIITARAPRSGAQVVVICGLIALLHYSLLLVAGKAYGDGNSGFGAIATIDEVQNYQATSYYLGICGIFFLAIYSAGFRHLWLVTAGLALVMFLMATVGSRASTVGLVFVCLVALASQRFTKILLGFFISITIASVLLVIYMSMASTSLEEITSTLPIFERFSVLAGDDDSSHRLRLFSAAIDLWLSSVSTLFFGSGLGSFPLFTGQLDEQGWYPHNFILETLAEGGLVALLFLIPPLFTLLQHKTPIRRWTKFEKIFFFYFSIYSLVSYMFMGGLSAIWIPFLPWIIFILLKKHDK